VNPFEDGIALIRDGSYFEAHEELELAWRAAEAEERAFFQGLVHVAVAWYQASRRLTPYAPAHRGVDVASVLEQVERARAIVSEGSLELEPPRV